MLILFYKLWHKLKSGENCQIVYSLFIALFIAFKKTKIMASGPITSWEIDAETVETVSDFIFWVPKSLQMVTAAMKFKDACSLEEKL